MNYVSDPKQKVELISNRLRALLGKKIQRYELAQLWDETTREWSYWMDVPLFLTVGNSTLSISWYKFDELAIEWGRVLPFSLVGSTVRWVSDGVNALDAATGRKITAISLGRGEMSIEKNEIETWTRLLFTLDNGTTLEIFNALDENGIQLHTSQVPGETIKCI